MFEHSIKVPRLYKSAAKIVERVKQNGESVKQVYDDKFKHRNVKALYALIVSTVQNDSNLELLLMKSELLSKETRLDPWLAKVLITELLWGKKRLPGNSKPVQTIISYQASFNLYLNELKQPRNCRDKVDKLRYVRVNTLKIAINEAIEAFIDEGWVLVTHIDQNDYPKFLTKISHLHENEFIVDIHIPYLLIFPSKTEFYNHNAYKNGLIALQDKASCIAAHILNPSPHSKVLDMCAAPGMKTTQLACIMNGTGVIYAIERDVKRADTLRSMIRATDAQHCVQVVNRDVLDVCNKKHGGQITDDKSRLDDDLYRQVDYILVDPSCSGSGVVEDNYRTDKDRLKKLAGFQIMILKHALRSFPAAKRVVYSTCSLNTEENEEVVREVLQSTQHYELIDASTLCKPWKNFGGDIYGDIGRFCLYSKPEEDLTQGFFIAVFERLETDDLQQQKQSVDKITNEKRANKRQIKQSKLKANIETTTERFSESTLCEDNFLLSKVNLKKKHSAKDQTSDETTNNKSGFIRTKRGIISENVKNDELSISEDCGEIRAKRRRKKETTESSLEKIIAVLKKKNKKVRLETSI